LFVDCGTSEYEVLVGRITLIPGFIEVQEVHRSPPENEKATDDTERCHGFQKREPYQLRL